MKINSLVVLLLLLAACVSHPKVPVTSVAQGPEDYDYKRFEGTYQGLFNGTDIRIVLRHVTSRHAVGYDLHKGLRRNISGTLKQDGNHYRFILLEPGDNPYDGVFNFIIDTSTFALTGNWKPADAKNRTEKEFVLKRMKTDSGLANGESMAYGDSLGDFHFNTDGQCLYQYYPVAGGQMSEIKGNWSVKGNAYVISWAPNKVFPNKISRFTMKHFKDEAGNDTEEIEELAGEGRTLTDINIP